jgi:hypothetical protein
MVTSPMGIGSMSHIQFSSQFARGGLQSKRGESLCVVQTPQQKIGSHILDFNFGKNLT